MPQILNHITASVTRVVRHAPASAGGPGSGGPGGLSIRQLLVTSIAAATLVVAALCAWQVSLWGEQELERREQQRLQATARGIGVRLSAALDERHAQLLAVRDLFERELRDASAADRRAVLNRTRAGLARLSWLGVTDAAGTIRLATDGLLEGVSVSGRTWFLGGLAGPAFFGDLHSAKLLEPHLGVPGGEPLRLLDIALPLRDETGSPIGVLGAHVDGRLVDDLMQQTLESLASRHDLAAAVVAADGTVLFDTRPGSGPAGAWLATIGPQQMRAATWRQASEPIHAVIEPLAGGRADTRLPWRIVVRAPAEGLHAGVVDMRWQVIGISLGVGLLLVLAGLLAARQATRPIEALADRLRRIGHDQDELAALAQAGPPPRALHELRLLHEAFATMAGRVTAHQRELQAHQRELQDTQLGIVQALARAGEFRDNETGEHLQRMSLCTARLAELAGLPADQVAMLQLASQLHDLGKIGVPDGILLKPGRLDATERLQMQRHPEIGAQILSGIDTPLTTLARTIALCHHEKWDGSGYPHGLAGTAIPLPARLVAVCDVFDALLTVRVYKRAWSLDEVLGFLRSQAGAHFDPDLVALFLLHADDFVRIRTQVPERAAAAALAAPPGGPAA